MKAIVNKYSHFLSDIYSDFMPLYRAYFVNTRIYGIPIERTYVQHFCNLLKQIRLNLEVLIDSQFSKEEACKVKSLPIEKLWINYLPDKFKEFSLKYEKVIDSYIKDGTYDGIELLKELRYSIKECNKWTNSMRLYQYSYDIKDFNKQAAEYSKNYALNNETFEHLKSRSNSEKNINNNNEKDVLSMVVGYFLLYIIGSPLILPQWVLVSLCTGGKEYDGIISIFIYLGIMTLLAILIPHNKSTASYSGDVNYSSISSDRSYYPPRNLGFRINKYNPSAWKSSKSPGLFRKSRRGFF